MTIKDSCNAENEIALKLKLNRLLNSLPSAFCPEFFTGIEGTTTIKTRVAYSYDLNGFFKFVHGTVPHLMIKPISEITLKDLEQLDTTDIAGFLKLMPKKSDGHPIFLNASQSRRLAAVRTLYNYFWKKRCISLNPAAILNIEGRTISRSTSICVDEIQRFIDVLPNPKELVRGSQYSKFIKYRDLIIISLFLVTGIRISSLICINIGDVNIESRWFLVYSNDEVRVFYFTEDVKQVFEQYILCRRDILANSDHENALFLSLQKKRISVRTVQSLIEKYSKTAQLQKITPRILRNIFATNLYKETKNICLVSDALNLLNLNEAKKYCSDIDKEEVKKAVQKIRLRNVSSKGSKPKQGPQNRP